MIHAQADLTRWRRLIEAEYRESPGLHLTKRQVQRLWGLDVATCDALLAVLQDANFLRRTSKNAYARTDIGR